MKEINISVNFNNQNYIVAAHIRQVSDEWIVCLHGIKSNKALFDEIFSRQYFKKYSILTLDFIGFGNSSKPDDFSYDVKDQAEIVVEAIEQLNIKKLHIIGHSLGGMVGTLLLERVNHKIIKFVNMEGNLVFEDCGLSKKVVHKSFEEFKSAFYPKMKSDLRSSNAIGADKKQIWIESTPDYAFYKSSQSIVSWSKSEKLKEIYNNSSIKKLFIYGDKNTYKVTSVTTGSLAKINNAGHAMLLDNPQECWKKIEEFMDD